MTADQLWNARARYLQSISKETEQKIIARSIRYTDTGMEAEAAMDLAVHQQRLVDWMADHPRKPVDKVVKALNDLTPEELAQLQEALRDA